MARADTALGEGSGWSTDRLVEFHQEQPMLSPSGAPDAVNEFNIYGTRRRCMISWSHWDTAVDYLASRHT